MGVDGLEYVMEGVNLWRFLECVRKGGGWLCLEDGGRWEWKEREGGEEVGKVI